MSSTQAPTAGSAPAAEAGGQRFDRKFIEEHRLLERYLDGKLPVKGARQLENWCLANPEYLAEQKLAERAQASLKLLDAIGRPQDLGEPTPPWWRTPPALISLAAFALICLVALWALYGKYLYLKSELNDARSRQQQGSLVQPSAESRVTMVPDRAAGIDRARLLVNRAEPQLVDLHLDLSHSKYSRFRLVVDKKDQGRALIVNEVLRDSNGELRATFNTSSLSAGSYVLRIEGLPFEGTPVAEGWLIVEVR